MKLPCSTGIVPVMFAIALCAPAAPAAPLDSTTVVERSEYGLVVSGTRTLKNSLEIPASVDVVHGDVLRRRGVRTLAEALQDVTGIAIGDGSDNGARLPNVGVWGLQEFDALLVSVDGVPVGGPFNPALEQIPVEDIDRIEVTRGPQGTLYGLSAFAGMIQVFTRPTTETGGEVWQQVTSYDGIDGGFAWNGAGPGSTRARVTGSAGRGDGWQDRTDFTRFRSAIGLARSIGRGELALTLHALEDRQHWGTPVPVDNGEIVQGFDPDRNDAVLGARSDHLVLGGTANLTWPMGEAMRLESTLGVSSDRQRLVRNFVDVETLAGDSVDADGQNLRPVETTGYADARLVRTMGAHEVVGGAAFTIGKLRVEGSEFDVNVKRLPNPVVPDLSQVNTGEDIDAEDMRVLVGAFLHDSWAIHPRITLSGGGRLDVAHEELEGGDPGTPEFTKEDREDTGWSADFGVLGRLLREAAAEGNAVNLYANVRRNFKPAAPNVFEAAEGLKILEPEHSLAVEGGFKSRLAEGQVELEGSVFRMELDNQVVVVDSTGTLGNAGKTRFTGEEVKLRLAPAALAGFAIEGGYAHHDPRFVHFTRPNGASVDGKQVELAPKELWNLGASWAGPRGASLWVAARGVGERPLNKRNTFFAESYSMWDAGAALTHGAWRFAVIGRNLSDERPIVAESEIGDSQFYVAAPRRVTAQISVKM